jgi:molybdopterin-guanine dinucleotide biosynthesis protein A
VVLAGGESRRFGGEKALFPLLGRAMAAWALDALKPWTSEQVVITHDRKVAEALGVPGRPDRIPGLGPLGGLHTALTWAKDEGQVGVFLLACDLPLVTGELVGRILRKWPSDSRAAVPGSHGPLGFEPLCGGYEVRGLPGLEELIRTGKRSMESALNQMGSYRIPPGELGTQEELALAFTNVNTLEMAHRAEGFLRDSVPALEGDRDRDGDRMEPERGR